MVGGSRAGAEGRVGVGTGQSLSSQGQPRGQWGHCGLSQVQLRPGAGQGTAGAPAARGTIAAAVGALTAHGLQELRHGADGERALTWLSDQIGAGFGNARAAVQLRLPQQAQHRGGGLLPFPQRILLLRHQFISQCRPAALSLRGGEEHVGSRREHGI